MKKFSSQIIIFSLIALVLISLLGNVFINGQLENSTKDVIQRYFIIKDVVIIVAYVFFTKYALNQIHSRYSDTFAKFKKNNSEITEAKERYDVVAKATSNTIWDWQIESDKLVWNKVFKVYLATKKVKLVATLIGGLAEFIPKTA